jgi:hypothetical protein
MGSPFFFIVDGEAEFCGAKALFFFRFQYFRGYEGTVLGYALKPEL